MVEDAAAKKKATDDAKAAAAAATFAWPTGGHFSTHGFAVTLKPEKFTRMHFKRWQTRTTLWLTALNVFLVGGVSPTLTFAPEQENAFRKATTSFIGAVLTMIEDKLVDAYLHMRVTQNLRDVLEAKFSATDAGSELYAMKQFHDYKMVDNCSVLDLAHEIQCIAKELELLKCELPDKFVKGCIIAKLPPGSSNFATSLKHLKM